MFSTGWSHLSIKDTILWFITLYRRYLPSIIRRCWCWSSRNTLRSSCSYHELLLKMILLSRRNRNIIKKKKRSNQTYLITICVIIVVSVSVWLFLIRNRTIPSRRSTEFDETIGLQVVAMETDLLPLIQWTNRPDDGL